MTIERGYDPRDFVIYAYGGAGPLHGAAFGSEAGAQEIVFPLGPVASTFSALGLAASDLVAATQVSDPALAPFDLEHVNNRFEELDRQAVEKVGAAPGDDGVRIQRVLELRYKGQVHQVETPVPNGPLAEHDMEQVIAEFERRYEALYGRGSAFREAGIELQTYHVTATLAVGSEAIHERRDAGAGEARPVGAEDIYWWELGATARTDIYRELVPNSRMVGPAVIRLDTTTALIPPRQTATVDGYLNIRVTKNLEAH
jgi:N-methylhydantoinase A